MKHVYKSLKKILEWLPIILAIIVLLAIAAGLFLFALYAAAVNPY